MFHALGTAYGTRPSALLGIEGEFLALNFDALVLVVGRESEQAFRDERPSKYKLLLSGDQTEDKPRYISFKDYKPSGK